MAPLTKAWMWAAGAVYSLGGNISKLVSRIKHNQLWIWSSSHVEVRAEMPASKANQ